MGKKNDFITFGAVCGRDAKTKTIFLIEGMVGGAFLFAENGITVTKRSESGQ